MPQAARLKGVKAAKPDEKIRREMKEVDDEFQKASVKYRPPDMKTKADQDKNGLGSRFPSRLTAYNPRDDLEELRASLPQEVYGVKTLQPETLEWVRSKKQNEQYAEFVNWAENYFDMTDPAQQRIVEEMMPEYFERRIDQIDEVTDLQNRIAKLRLTGPRSKDDLFLIYMLVTGKLPVPQGAIWDPEKWYPFSDATGKNDADRFARGLFNPRRYVAAPNKRGAYDTRWNWWGAEGGAFGEPGAKNGSATAGVYKSALAAAGDKINLPKMP